MRINDLLDPNVGGGSVNNGGGVYAHEGTVFNTAGTEATPEAPSAPPAPVTPQETPVENPGPASNPQNNQTGNPPPPRPPSPAPTGQGAGLQSSEATGGLQGTFQQAGTAGFGRQFGSTSPASWFRNMAREGGPMPGGVGSKTLATTRGGAAPGGALQDLITGGGGEGDVAGANPNNDAEWQRFMQAVIKARFGQ